MSVPVVFFAYRHYTGTDGTPRDTPTRSRETTPTTHFAPGFDLRQPTAAAFATHTSAVVALFIRISMYEVFSRGAGPKLDS